MRAPTGATSLRVLRGGTEVRQDALDPLPACLVTPGRLDPCDELPAPGERDGAEGRREDRVGTERALEVARQRQLARPLVQLQADPHPLAGAEAGGNLHLPAEAQVRPAAVHGRRGGVPI